MSSYTWREIELAEPAWHYPNKGSIQASCGHKLGPDEGSGESISWWDWNEWGDLVEFSGCHCTWCAIRLKVSGRHIDTWVWEEHRDDWLAAQWDGNPKGGER